MNKTLLKKLIREVIQEAEVESEKPKSKEPEKPKLSKEPPTDDRGAVIQLKLRGLKPGSEPMKRLLAALARETLAQEMEVIRAQVTNNGKRIISMDVGELESSKYNAPITKKTEPRDEEPKHSDQMSSDERLSQIQTGEKSGEWKNLTDKDVSAAKERARLKNSKIAAGTYDPDRDTELWSDEDWDGYNQGDGPSRGVKGDNNPNTRPWGGKSSTSKRDLSNKTGRKLPKLHIGTLRQ